MQISHSQAIALLPNALHIYSNVTEKELEDIKVVKYVTKVEDVVVVGTLEEVEALVSKEVIAGSMNFG